MSIDVEKVVESLNTCLLEMSLIVSDEDIVHIADSMAYTMYEYGVEEYENIEESELHPNILAEKALVEYGNLMEEHGGDTDILKGIRMDDAILAATINQKAIPYASHVIDRLKGIDEECIMDVLASFSDFIDMNFGDVAILTLDCADDVRYLTSFVDVIDIDMMGEDFDSPPVSLDRGEPKVFVPGEEIDDEATMASSRAILSRLSGLTEEQRDKLSSMIEERDRFGQLAYTTTDIVNKANKMVLGEDSEGDEE